MITDQALQDELQHILEASSRPGACPVTTVSSALATLTGTPTRGAVARAFRSLVEAGVAVEVRKGDMATEGRVRWSKRSRERIGWVRASSLTALRERLVTRGETARADASFRACRARAEAIVLARHREEVDAELAALLHQL
ncbi:MAG: hypothetical protein V4755_07235 [Curtobacterium sp.]